MDGVQDTVPEIDSGADRFLGGGLGLHDLVSVIPAQGFGQSVAVRGGPWWSPSGSIWHLR